MGIGPFHSSSCSCEPERKVIHVHCDCDEKIQKLEKRLARFPNPNPRNFRIIKYGFYNDKYLVAMIHYPDCTNYEGNKIMVFEGIDPIQLEKLTFIDPHFCDGNHLSPIARFEPTDRGWVLACKLVRVLSNE